MIIFKAKKAKVSTTEWHKHFVIFPTKTVDGSWIAFQHVLRRWDFDLNPWGYDGHSGTDGGWEYKLIEEQQQVNA